LQPGNQRLWVNAAVLARRYLFSERAQNVDRLEQDVAEFWRHCAARLAYRFQHRLHDMRQVCQAMVSDCSCRALQCVGGAKEVVDQARAVFAALDRQ
jgi:hypothetical protein